MPTYIALLRGVNVGQNTLRMDRLRVLCSELGLKNARTYLQSGNVVFEARRTSSHWSRAIEQKLAGESRLAVSIIVRTGGEMTRVMAGNPFLKEKAIDPAKMHVTFLQQAPAKIALQALDVVNDGSDRFECAGMEIYLHCPNGYGRTKLSNNVLEKVLSVRATTRNWKTVKKLCEMSSE